MVIIGVDPAIRKDGFAICLYDIINSTVDFKVMDFIDFILYIENLNPIDYIFCVENSNLQNLSFDMTGSKNIVARKSRNVGMNQAVSQLTCDLLKRHNFEVIELSPKEKGAKLTDAQVKILMKYDKEVKNYKGLKGEQDKRDAYKLSLLGKSKKKL